MATSIDAIEAKLGNMPTLQLTMFGNMVIIPRFQIHNHLRNGRPTHAPAA